MRWGRRVDLVVHTSGDVGSPRVSGAANASTASPPTSLADLGARRRPRNHHRRDETPMIRTGNLHRAQRSRRAASSQYVIDGDEWG